MNLLRTAEFIADIERQYQWYFVEAGSSVADAYLAAVETTCSLLKVQPGLGPKARFKHKRLRNWRFFLAARPFQAHILFYEITEDSLVFRRAMHGSRDLARRLIENEAS